SKVHRLGVEVHFFRLLASGRIMRVLAPEKNWEHSIKLQLPAGNVGFMRRLHYNALAVSAPPTAPKRIKGRGR
ncbi:hypothetical protein CVE22_09075, partial [Pseudomonas syringae pv. actinidiae]|nr:hypothetical protein [Pseudomonas syringae pv. actinidiae]